MTTDERDKAIINICYDCDLSQGDMATAILRVVNQYEAERRESSNEEVGCVMDDYGLCKSHPTCELVRGRINAGADALKEAREEIAAYKESSHKMATELGSSIARGERMKAAIGTALYDDRHGDHPIAPTVRELLNSVIAPTPMEVGIDT